MVVINELIKCSRCKKTMISEEFDNHNCSPILIGNRTILLDYYTKGNDENGNEMFLAKGMDGIMYTLIVDTEPAVPIPFNPSDEIRHRDDPTNTGQNPQDCLNMSD